MALQQSVNIYQSPAVAGDRASQNPVVYKPANYIAGEGGVTVGGFVWEDPDSEGDPVAVLPSGSDAPLGFVERILENSNYEIKEDGALTIPAGGLVSVAVKGDFYVTADVAANAGDSVYADASTGAANFSGSGVETGWKALHAADAGDLVAISNWE